MALHFQADEDDELCAMFATLLSNGLVTAEDLQVVGLTSGPPASSRATSINGEQPTSPPNSKVRGALRRWRSPDGAATPSESRCGATYSDETPLHTDPSLSFPSAAGETPLVRGCLSESQRHANMEEAHRIDVAPWKARSLLFQDGAGDEESPVVKAPASSNTALCFTGVDVLVAREIAHRLLHPDDDDC